VYGPSRSRLVAGAIVALVSLVLGTGAASARRAAPPEIKITFPSRCACGIVTPQTSTVEIIVQVKNLKLSKAHFGKAPVPGEGHLLFSLDRGKFDHPKYSGDNGRLGASIGVEGKYSPAVTPKIVYRNVPEGSHTVVVYVVANNHKKLGPSTSLKFTVQ